VQKLGRLHGKKVVPNRLQDFDENNMNNGEITGISFQKVDEGIVQTVVDSDKFSPVDWEQLFFRVDDTLYILYV
jgi:hypothetical protein